MGMIIDLHNELQEIRGAGPAAVTANGNGAGIDLQNYQGKLKATLDSAAASAGTNPTLDIKVQDSADDTTFADVTGLTFSQVTDAAVLESIAIDTRAVRRYIRFVDTIGGTSSPSFTRAVSVVGQQQSR